MRLHVAIAVGLTGGLLFGLAVSVSGSPTLLAFVNALEPLGRGFVNLLRMVVIPLVATTLFVGVAGMGDLKKLGRLGALTVGFVVVSTFVAVPIGMGVMHALLPLASDAAAQAVTGAAAEAPKLPTMVDFLVDLIPSNPFQAAAQGALLPMIVFTLLMGAATGSLPEADRERLLAVARPVSDALIKLVYWALWVAPFGVFALAAQVTARAGWALLQSLGVFILAVLIGLVIFTGAVYVGAARWWGGVAVGRFLRACVGPQLIGFTTTSSAATLPAILQAADRELGLDKGIASFVLPLSASINRAGSGLFQGAGVVFLAWLYSVPLPAAAIGGAILSTALVSFTVAAVPSAAVVTLAPALGHVGVPLDGMGVLLGVDRIPDMLRTAANVTGHMAIGTVAERIGSNKV
ncbi:MAG TPA: dicarboxylate/amino acid:cation symporter [Gemmatimonadales bacterium]|nr:dicarboxylate/amino acid:cation symporter [Gemmatimonadales bacterium]